MISFCLREINLSIAVKCHGHLFQLEWAFFFLWNTGTDFDLYSSSESSELLKLLEDFPTRVYFLNELPSRSFGESR